MKQFLIIVVLIFIYIFFINMLSQTSFQLISSSGSSQSGGGEVVGIGQAVEVSVRRPYLFGLIYLPVYIEGLGDIGIYHDTFFAFIFALTIALIIKEIKNRKERNRKIRTKRR